MDDKRRCAVINNVRMITTSSISAVGISNIGSIRIFSRIERSPAAGLACNRLLGHRAQRILAEFKRYLIHLKQFLILLDERVLRLGQIRISASSSRSSSVATTGSRPTNSGINPNLIRSSGSRSDSNSPVLRRPVPGLWRQSRCQADSTSTSLSSPAKAPPQINRILVVSTCRNSCCGCLRPPWGGLKQQCLP